MSNPQTETLIQISLSITLLLLGTIYFVVVDFGTPVLLGVQVSIDMGGHHLDLFWPTEQDPQSVRYVDCFDSPLQSFHYH